MSSKEVAGTVDLDDRKADCKEQIGRALGRLASGVYIVTWLSENQPQGLLATWISQIAFEPPMLSVAINKQRPLATTIEPGMPLAINVLSKQNMDIFKAFAKPAGGPEQDRFSELEMLAAQNACPVFAKAVSYINGKVTATVPAGDHLLALIEVTGGALLNEDEPMTHLRKSGFQY